MPRRLVLASSSPYRRALLERLRLPFDVAVPAVDETPHEREHPRAIALRLAEAKARAVASARPGDVVIGSDQVASLEGRPFGKPGGREAALAQLLAMRGRTVVFHTGLCVVAAGQTYLDEVPTEVQWRTFDIAQAERYLDRDTPYDCAGSARIEALGIALVERVQSTDPTALIGLPLIALVTLLSQAGVEVL